MHLSLVCICILFLCYIKLCNIYIYQGAINGTDASGEITGSFTFLNNIIEMREK